MDSERYKLYDNAGWYFEDALKNYIQLFQKSTLTDEDYKMAEEYAGMHIAFFITWIIKNRFESAFFSTLKGGAEAVESLRNEEITGSYFLSEYCDGKLDGEMLSDEIIPFVDQFYEKHYFYKFYAPWVINDLNDLPFEFEWAWENYHSFEKVLDKRYKTYLDWQKTFQKYRQKQQ